MLHSSTKPSTAGGVGGAKPSKKKQKGERYHAFLGAGVGALWQAPATSPTFFGVTNAREESSSPFWSSATPSENPGHLLAAAQGLVESCSLSWAVERPGRK
jgi:hypothetical protein